MNKTFKRSLPVKVYYLDSKIYMYRIMEAASKLGRLLENRIKTRFAVHTDIEIIEETTLCQAYGNCCFGIDHFIRYGSRQVHIQEKWESHAPKLRDIRHFIVASNALTGKLPLLEVPLRIYLSRRPVNAPESLFALQASGSESLSNYTDIEIATEELYKRVCRHFCLEPKPLTPDLIESLAKATVEYEEDVRSHIIHHLQPIITIDLQNFAQTIAPPLLNVMYGQQLGIDIINHIQSLASQNNIAQIIRFFKSRRATPLEYDTWITVLYSLRPIQIMMEQVNADTGRRIYTRSQIGEPALQPTEQEQVVERSRLHNIYKKRTVVNVIKDN